VLNALDGTAKHARDRILDTNEVSGSIIEQLLDEPDRIEHSIIAYPDDVERSLLPDRHVRSSIIVGPTVMGKLAQDLAAETVHSGAPLSADNPPIPDQYIFCLPLKLIGRTPLALHVQQRHIVPGDQTRQAVICGNSYALCRRAR
jgi:hypothetical protein